MQAIDVEAACGGEREREETQSKLTKRVGKRIFIQTDPRHQAAQALDKSKLRPHKEVYPPFLESYLLGKCVSLNLSSI
jgi:hypothetical protein